MVRERICQIYTKHITNAAAELIVADERVVQLFVEITPDNDIYRMLLWDWKQYPGGLVIMNI